MLLEEKALRGLDATALIPREPARSMKARRPKKLIDSVQKTPEASCWLEPRSQSLRAIFLDVLRPLFTASSME